MADILQFRPPQNTSAGPARKLSQPAEVIIFPGVRIERDGFSLADRLVGKKGLRGRAARSRKKHDREPG